MSKPIFLEDSLYEMTKPVFWKKNKKIINFLYAGLAQSGNG